MRRRPVLVATAAVALLVAACDGGGPDEAAILAEAVRGLDLRGADVAELERQAARLRALDLHRDDARRVRDACVDFREALARAESDRARAVALEAAGERVGVPALLERIEAAIARADRAGVACEDGLRRLAAPTR